MAVELLIPGYTKATEISQIRVRVDCIDLKALAVNNLRTRFVVLLLGDPHLLKGGERSQDGAADPDRVFALGRRDDLDLHGSGSKRLDFLLHAGVDTIKHGGTTRQHDVAIQVLADIDIALHDGVIGGGMHASRLLANERGLEQDFRAAETLVANSDNLAVGQLVITLALMRSSRICGDLHLFIKCSA